MTETQTPSTELAPQKAGAKKGTFAYLLQEALPSIEAVIPRHLSAERLMKIARVAYSRSPKLQECTAVSLIQCVMEAAELGLDVSGTLGTAYLVPFKNHGVMEATLIIGYRGMIELARRSGMIQSVEARAVFHGEEFSMTHGMNPSLTHNPDIDKKPAEKDFRGCYMVARLKDGGTHVEWMNKEEINAIRDQSKAGRFGPWKDYYIEMAKKTVLRRGFKMLPMSPEMVSAFVHSDQMEFGDAIIDTTATPIDGKDAGESKIDALKDAIVSEQLPDVKTIQVADQVAALADKAREAQAEAQAKTDVGTTKDAKAETLPGKETVIEIDEKGVVREVTPVADANEISDAELAALEPDGEDADTPRASKILSPSEKIIAARYDELVLVIGERAGYHPDAPREQMEATTQRWLESKKWTQTALLDDALWNIVMTSANKARFRKPTATAST